MADVSRFRGGLHVGMPVGMHVGVLCCKEGVMKEGQLTEEQFTRTFGSDVYVSNTKT